MFPVVDIFPETNKEPETPEFCNAIKPLRDINSLGMFK